MNKVVPAIVIFLFWIMLSACETAVQGPDPIVLADTAIETGDQPTSENRRPNGPPGAGAGPGSGRGPGPSGGVQVPVPDITPSALAVYKTLGELELNAHIFNPEGHSADDSRPVIIFLHGGALRFGDPTEGYRLAEYFNPMGVVVISAEYRLIGTDAETVDQLVADTKSLTRWTREQANRLGINPENIMFSGHGTGAYLAMLGTLLEGHNAPSDNLMVSAVPDSVVFWSLVTTRRDNPQNSIVPEGYTMADFSAPERVSDELPPALFVHGELDPAVSPALALAFHETYSQAGNQSSYHSIEGADHVFADPDHAGQVFELITDFMSDLGYLAAK